MAKDPAFLFYPGDYLRDTQCLSEKSQVAYDRIMCEHMRNICEDMSKIAISKTSLNFFIKRLSEDEKTELMRVLKKSGDGFQIEWVAESISKRKSYTISRSKNRSSKPKNISSSYDSHMENEIENEIEVDNTNGSENFLVPALFEKFKYHLPKYPGDKKKDYKHLLSIANFLAEQGKLKSATENPGQILEAWDVICQVIKTDKFYSQKSLSTIANQIQEILQISLNGKFNGKRVYATKETGEQLDRMFDKRYGSGRSATG